MGHRGRERGDRQEARVKRARLGLQGQMGRSGLGCWALFSLSLFQISSKKQKSKERKGEKKMSGQEFGHGDNFPGLTKM